MVDVGCGNGRLLAFLAERGWQGHYLGLDHSAELLAAARSQTETGRTPIRARFAQADLSDRDWPLRAAVVAPDAIACLAVLQHIPGAPNRAHLVRQCAGLLPPAGVLILSSWQFLSAPRLRARILPWATVGLTDEDVEAGDYLIAWGAGAAGRRYCAAIDRAALADLAAQAGLAPVEMFYADGHEGNLNLYGVFRLSAR